MDGDIYIPHYPIRTQIAAFLIVAVVVVVYAAWRILKERKKDRS